MPLIATAAVSAVSGLVNSVTDITDKTKRRLYEQNLASLSFDQKLAIDKMLKEASSEDARQQILQQTLGNLGGARINAISVVQVEKEKTKKTMLIIGGIIAVLAVVGIIVTLNKKSK
jgi:hypothetical protein